MDETRALRDLAELVTICEATRNAPIVPEKQTLAELEEKILRESAYHGRLTVRASSDAAHCWVCTHPRYGNQICYQKDGDPAVAAFGMEAFKTLCQRGYVVYSGDNEFVLSASGFRVAREIVAERINIIKKQQAAQKRLHKGTMPPQMSGALSDGCSSLLFVLAVFGLIVLILSVI